MTLSSLIDLSVILNSRVTLTSSLIAFVVRGGQFASLPLYMKNKKISGLLHLQSVAGATNAFNTNNVMIFAVEMY